MAESDPTPSLDKSGAAHPAPGGAAVVSAVVGADDIAAAARAIKRTITEARRAMTKQGPTGQVTT